MRSDRRSKRGATEGEIRVGWRMGGLGMEVATQVGAGALLGWLFDRWRGSAPTGLLVGATIGIVVGLWSLIKGALKLNRALDRKTPRRRAAAPDDNERADE
jgi:F0F1-type ATP synthase assembly protein I